MADFSRRFLLLGVFCGEDFRSSESRAQLSSRVETTRRKLKQSRCHKSPLVPIRTRIPTRTPPNGHSTRSLTAIGQGSGHQAENRIANLRCAARLAVWRPATRKVMTRVFIRRLCGFSRKLFPTKRIVAFSLRWTARGSKNRRPQKESVPLPAPTRVISIFTKN